MLYCFNLFIGNLIEGKYIIIAQMLQVLTLLYHLCNVIFLSNQLISPSFIDNFYI
jgi:hypothetical protein